VAVTTIRLCEERPAMVRICDLAGTVLSVNRKVRRYFPTGVAGLSTD